MDRLAADIQVRNLRKEQWQGELASRRTEVLRIEGELMDTKFKVNRLLAELASEKVQVREAKKGELEALCRKEEAIATCMRIGKNFKRTAGELREEVKRRHAELVKRDKQVMVAKKREHAAICGQESASVLLKNMEGKVEEVQNASDIMLECILGQLVKEKKRSRRLRNMLVGTIGSASGLLLAVTVKAIVSRKE